MDDLKESIMRLRSVVIAGGMQPTKTSLRVVISQTEAIFRVRTVLGYFIRTTRNTLLGELEILSWDTHPNLCCNEQTRHTLCFHCNAVDKQSVNGLVGTGFASRYRLEPRAGF